MKATILPCSLLIFSGKRSKFFDVPIRHLAFGSNDRMATAENKKSPQLAAGYWGKQARNCRTQQAAGNVFRERFKTINGVPHIRTRTGAYRQIREIIGGMLDGAVQIRTRRKWKWMKGPRKRARRPVTTQKPSALPALTIAAQSRPPGYEIIVWTDKYRVLKQYAAAPQNRGDRD